MNTKAPVIYHGQSLYFGNQAINQSLNQTNRSLRSSEHCLLNRLRSIDQDNEFLIASLRELTVDVPVAVNLRCGRWYVNPNIPSNQSIYRSNHQTNDKSTNNQSTNQSIKHFECYFKSSDGHCLRWVFSINRLNLHVIHAASGANNQSNESSIRGLIIIDSTRKGKQFPDSFTRTIPIWCAVINRSIKRYRQSINKSTNPSSHSSSEQSVDEDWDDSLHVHHSVSDSERVQIEDQIDRWVEFFMQSVDEPTFKSINQSMKYPLVPICVGRSDASSINELINQSIQSDYTPLILFNPSAPQNDTIYDDKSINHSISETIKRSGWSYIQGAADDEANWARNLTPELFWNNQTIYQTISDPIECEVFTDQLVSDEKKKQMNEQFVDAPIHRIPGTNLFVSCSDKLPNYRHVEQLINVSIEQNKIKQLTQSNQSKSETVNQSHHISCLYLRTISDKHLNVSINKYRRAREPTDEAFNQLINQSINQMINQEMLDSSWPDQSVRIIAVSGVPKDKESLLDILDEATEFVISQTGHQLVNNQSNNQLNEHFVLISGDDWTNVTSLATAVMCMQDDAHLSNNQHVGEPSNNQSIDQSTEESNNLSIQSNDQSVDKNVIRRVSARVHAALPGHFPTRLQLKQLNRFVMSRPYEAERINKQ